MTILDDPRTRPAIREWRKRAPARLKLRATPSAALLDALGDRENALWIGAATHCQTGREGLLAITSRRVVAAADDGSIAVRDVASVTALKSHRSWTLKWKENDSALAWQLHDLDDALVEALRFSDEFEREAPSAQQQKPGRRGNTDTPARGSLDWGDAELVAAAHMVSLGFSDASVTASGPDGGVDVRATGAVAQVKHFTTSMVGRPVVQQIRGAAPVGATALCYAYSGFTAGAIDFANETGVALYLYDSERRVTAISEMASNLTRHAQAAGHGEIPSVDDVLRARSEAQAAFDGAMAEFRRESDEAMDRIKLLKRKRKKAQALLEATRSVEAVAGLVDALGDRDVPLHEILDVCAQIRDHAAQSARIAR